MIGAVLGNRYEVLELVGTGGMANVYKAKCTLLNRNVAIKVLKEEFKDDEEIIKRFNIESQAVAGLSHTNIVSVFDVGTEGDLHYIVMEYVEGITLKEYLKDSGALVWNKAVDFSLQICSALQHAHRKGIVHRDIKPHNIMVTKDDVLKVMDFGIARAVTTHTTKLDTEALGTAHYCSPEQAKGSYTDERSDIYSLGVVMYEMLTGKLPFESDSSVSVALKQIQEKPVPPSQIVPTIPPSVEAAVLKAMEKDAVDRFQTANTLLIELNWIKQTETAPKAVKYTEISEEEKFATKKIKVDEAVVAAADKEKAEEVTPVVEEKEENEEMGTKKKVKGKGKDSKAKKPLTKEDKTAVIAAIISSIVIVAIMSFAVINFIFEDMLPWNKKPANEMIVPDLVGYHFDEVQKKYDDIEFVLGSEELSPQYKEAGIIISQTPDAETTITRPFKITVTVSKAAKEVKVPDVLNLDVEEAKRLLEKNDIEYRIVEKKNSTIPEGIVTAVNPAADTRVTAGFDVVTLTVSAGEDEEDDKEYAIVPNVVGKSEAVAKSMLEEAGLKATVKATNSDKPAGVVTKQSEPAGASLELKETVIIYVSKGSDSGTGEQGGNGQTGGSQTSAREVTVYLPSDKETAVVKVTLDGKTVYEKTHNCSEGAVSVVVRGSGSQRVITYVDGVVKGERVLDFE
ncbi:MAG: Stk1 family PASTA domain-containing Ser/Thr kinase [Clostridia bacterium]|nr:Stk1 family PASTA domain-containing Ser/Thr kinase [Clostridia bacterium]